jgi:hypothetical protein
MRIIDKQKDYYDCMLKYGQDPNIVWVRQDKVQEIVQNTPVFKIYGVQPVILGFCGKHYKLVCKKTEFRSKIFDIVVDDPNDVVKLKLDKYDISRNTDEKIKRWLSVDISSFKGFFEKFKTPCYVLEATSNTSPFREFSKDQPQPAEINTNIYLKNYQFQKVLDPQQAYQELEMYLNSELLLTG